MAVASLAFGLLHGVPNPNTFGEALGSLFGRLLLPVLCVSYLIQTGRHRWAIGVSGVLVVLMLLGFLLGVNRPPPVAQIEREFKQGCTSKCQPGVAANRCSALCDCVWDGIKAPGDRAVAESWKANQSSAERVIKELATRCAAGLAAEQQLVREPRGHRL